jgi:phosphoglycolate phosphatase-like HAD superfamily hydrolase
MPTVLLFDIDGTLVLTGGAGRRAMVGAFVELHAREDVFEGTSFAGMTDRAIARHGLLAVGHGRDSEAAIDEVLESYLRLLHAELARAEGYTILPGVEALLAAIRGLEGVAVGLGTGNIRRGAAAKLSHGGLFDAFAFGGFGCDAEDRVELLRAGAHRGAAALGAPLADCDVVVIGDTPKDVAAAKGLGARCIAVATGSYGAAELRACGADHAFETLAVEGVLEALLRSLSSPARARPEAGPR